jgi:hypothetical protein
MNQRALSFDALSRVTQFTNPLGVFNQTYDPVNLMLKILTNSVSQTICVILFLNLGLTVVGRVCE